MISIKTKEEIEIMKDGGCRLAKVMKEALSLAKPGISLSQINQKIEESILKKVDSLLLKWCLIIIGLLA